MMTNHTNLTCPICSSRDVFLFGSVDFNRHCIAEDIGFEPSGINIDYYICKECDFLYSPEICAWKKAVFESRIYNSDYSKYDPEYLEKRPKDNFKFLAKQFGGNHEKISHLDYGGGNGALTKMLNEHGINSQNFEPFSSNPVFPASKFNLITAFEVFEHVPDPNQIMVNISKLLDDTGIFISTTSVSDGHINFGKALDWWYVAPRNGHICIYSEKSLKILANRYGLHFKIMKNGNQVFWKKAPSWSKKYFGLSSKNKLVRFGYKIFYFLSRG